MGTPGGSDAIQPTADTQRHGNYLTIAEVERLNYIHRQRSRHRVVPYADIDFLLEMLAKLGVLFHGNR